MAKEKKKILFVITKSNFGGAQRYVFDLARSLPKDQFDVVVAFGGTGTTGAGAGKLHGLLTREHIRTIFIPNMTRDVRMFNSVWALMNPIVIITSVFAEFLIVFWLISLYRKERPAVVHLNSSKIGGLGSLAGRLAGVPNIIYTVHGWPFWEQRNMLIRAVIWFLSWLTALFSHHVVVVSKYDLRVAQKMPFVKSKFVHIYNGIAPMELGSGESIRNTFPEGAHITGTIGELNKNKNQIALVEEARRTPDMYVAIVGEGENELLLKKKIAEYDLTKRVKLFGFVPAKEVLTGFDTFALPSIKEGLPYVLIEAKNAGLPIVANRTIGGIAEIMDAEDMRQFSLTHMVDKTIALYNT